MYDEIIDRAIKNLKNGIATDEEKVIVKLYKHVTLERGFNNIYDHLKLPEWHDESIHNAFNDFEISLKKLYNTIRPFCGNYDQYTIELIYSYIDDFMINKTQKYTNPTAKFILYVVIRDEMDYGKYYSTKMLLDILKNSYPQYLRSITYQKMRLLLELGVQEGYFVKEIDEKTHPIYYTKTNKLYMF